MEDRGRKSAAELTVISGDGIVTVHRPAPAPDLDEDEAAEWIAIVNRLPADWFPRETHGMLAQYCAHVVLARKLRKLIKRAISGDFSVPEIDKLTSIHEREGRAASSLATRMRITQQSTMSEQRKKPKVMTLPKPWEGQ